jgi:3'-phosphoadenosine 5'-phosphosulfate sulfotransferase (PAPS reductase)/FAD synthetase
MASQLQFNTVPVPELSDTDHLDLNQFDIILLNTSGGKDSQTTMDHVVRSAKLQGFPMDRIMAVHADLGKLEWRNTWELVQEQCRHYGVPVVRVKRDEDLLDQVRGRGKWPSQSARFCTSDHKRDQIKKVITQLSRDYGKGLKVLNCMGIRAEESPNRALMHPLELNDRASCKSRTVINWLPIFRFTWDQVFSSIFASGVSYSKAYDLGMSRHSCIFCFQARKSELVLAAKQPENQALLQEMIQIETEIDHTFQNGRSLQEIQAIAQQELAEEAKAAQEEPAAPAADQTQAAVFFTGDTRKKAMVAMLQANSWGRIWIDRKPNTQTLWAFDNGAFKLFKKGLYVDLDTWMEKARKASTVPGCYLAVLPDKVGEGMESFRFSIQALEAAEAAGLNMPWYLVVQEGMDWWKVDRWLVANRHRIAGLFLGGASDEFKATALNWSRVAHWHGLKFHFGRAGTPTKIAQALAARSDSMDSAFPLWKMERMEEIEGMKLGQLQPVMDSLNPDQLARLHSIMDTYQADPSRTSHKYGEKFDGTRWASEEEQKELTRLDLQLMDLGALDFPMNPNTDHINLDEHPEIEEQLDHGDCTLIPWLLKKVRETTTTQQELDTMEEDSQELEREEELQAAAAEGQQEAEAALPEDPQLTRVDLLLKVHQFTQERKLLDQGLNPPRDALAEAQAAQDAREVDTEALMLLAFLELVAEEELLGPATISLAPLGGNPKGMAIYLNGHWTGLGLPLNPSSSTVQDVLGIYLPSHVQVLCRQFLGLQSMPGQESVYAVPEK